MSQAKPNSQKIDIESVIKQYPNFENTFNRSFIGIPSGLAGLSEPFYGTLEEVKVKLPDIFLSKQERTTVFYMEGSGKFSKGFTFREWITGEAGHIFFAPDSYQGEGRPTYTTPASKVLYEKVHQYRQAEINYAVSRLSELLFIDQSKMFLMGNSEGGLAAARYTGNEFKARIILSWACEAGYYTDFPDLGSHPDKHPILNIMGQNDNFFGKDSALNQHKNIQGHCAKALSDYKNAKIVLLPNTGHNLINNPLIKSEILSFIEMFKDYSPR